MDLSSHIITTALLILCFVTGSYSTSITTVNNCIYPVLTSIISSTPSPLPTNKTFLTLQIGESSTVDVPSPWSGFITGYPTVEYSEGTIPPPATVAEFQLNSAIEGGVDIYDVSVVEGYNIPMSVNPQGGTGTTRSCIATGCIADLNTVCVFDELKVMSEDGKVMIGCKSACQAFRDPQFCCTGNYSTPQTCKPTPYSLFFKNACPSVRSYLYDESSTWTFACVSPNYFVIFCPPISSLMAPFIDKSSAKKANSEAFLDGLTILKGLGISITLILTAYAIITYFKSRRENGVPPEVGLTVQPSLSLSA